MQGGAAGDFTSSEAGWDLSYCFIPGAHLLEAKSVFNMKYAKYSTSVKSQGIKSNILLHYFQSLLPKPKCVAT